MHSLTDCVTAMKVQIRAGCVVMRAGYTDAALSLTVAHARVGNRCRLSARHSELCSLCYQHARAASVGAASHVLLGMHCNMKLCTPGNATARAGSCKPSPVLLMATEGDWQRCLGQGYTRQESQDNRSVL